MVLEAPSGRRGESTWADGKEEKGAACSDWERTGGDGEMAAEDEEVEVGRTARSKFMAGRE